MKKKNCEFIFSLIWSVYDSISDMFLNVPFSPTTDKLHEIPINTDKNGWHVSPFINGLENPMRTDLFSDSKTMCCVSILSNSKLPVHCVICKK